MITPKAFWKGRDVQYASELTPEIKAAAAATMTKANLLLWAFYKANPKAYPRDANSGWRPASVNAATKGASPTSLHVSCDAVDIDDDDEQLDRWLQTKEGQSALTDIGLWMEHPSLTPRWCHVQTKPPKSGKRVFGK